MKRLLLVSVVLLLSSAWSSAFAQDAGTRRIRAVPEDQDIDPPSETPPSEPPEVDVPDEPPVDSNVDSNPDPNVDSNVDSNTDSEAAPPVLEQEETWPEVHDEPPVPPAPYDGIDPCATNYRGRPVGPLQVGDLDGMLAVAHRACPREEVAIGGDFLLVADTAALYGNLRINAQGRVSAPIFDPKVEAFLSWELFRYQSILSAVSSEYIGLGYLSFGVAGQVFNASGGVVAVTSRLVLPTTTGLDQGSFPFAMDVGVTAAYQVDATFRLHVFGLLLGSVGAGGPAVPRGGVRFGGGFDWIPIGWLSIVLEAVAGFGYRDDIDIVAGQFGIRLGFSDEVGLELAASMPFVSPRGLDDGALPLTASLMLNWHLPE